MILFVNACVRSESRTHELANTLLTGLKGEICNVELEDESISVMDRGELERRNTYLEYGHLHAPMFCFARQFAEADTIVIAAPYWDLMFPALLKIYLEAVTVCGITFRYSEQGIPVGLCKAKRLIYVTTAGGPIGDFDFGFQYISTLSRVFFGIPQVECVRAEGLDIAGADVSAILSEAGEQAKKLWDKF